MTPDTKKTTSEGTEMPRKKKAKAIDPSKKASRGREEGETAQARGADDGNPAGDPANDERKLARGAAIAIPLTTVFAAAVVGSILSAGPALLVLAAGILLGTIALFWASLRTLTGDAPLAEELEHASFSASNDALANRKKMLLRALKDLESEQAVGKIDAKDYGILSARYREEIKDLMREMDESIEPHVKAAELALQKHLAKVGLVGDPFRAPGKAAQAKDEALERDETPDETDDETDGEEDDAPALSRPVCTACSTSNEIDAKFCKSCGATLSSQATEMPKNLDALFDTAKKLVDEPVAKELEATPDSNRPGDVTPPGLVSEAAKNEEAKESAEPFEKPAAERAENA
jgi:hypothetical protein